MVSYMIISRIINPEDYWPSSMFDYQPTSLFYVAFPAYLAYFLAIFYIIFHIVAVNSYEAAPLRRRLGEPLTLRVKNHHRE